MRGSRILAGCAWLTVCATASVLGCAAPTVLAAGTQQAKGGAFQYGISTFRRVLMPKGFSWDPEVDGEIPGSQRGETIEGETLEAGCHIARRAALGTCTLEYWLVKTPPPAMPPAAFCVQKLRVRNLARRGALKTARRRHEFLALTAGERIREGNAYSYHGYAITCDLQAPQRREVVYGGDRE
jgi:hypothetical protein